MNKFEIGQEVWRLSIFKNLDSTNRYQIDNVIIKSAITKDNQYFVSYEDINFYSNAGFLFKTKQEALRVAELDIQMAHVLVKKPKQDVINHPVHYNSENLLVNADEK